MREKPYQPSILIMMLMLICYRYLMRSAYVQTWPSLYLFAFDACNIATCMDHVIAFYKENNHIPFNRRPRAIIVNKKFIIAQMNYEDETPPGITFSP